MVIMGVCSFFYLAPLKAEQQLSEIARSLQWFLVTNNVGDETTLKCQRTAAEMSSLPVGMATKQDHLRTSRPDGPEQCHDKQCHALKRGSEARQKQAEYNPLGQLPTKTILGK